MKDCYCLRQLPWAVLWHCCGIVKHSVVLVHYQKHWRRNARKDLCVGYTRDGVLIFKQIYKMGMWDIGSLFSCDYNFISKPKWNHCHRGWGSWLIVTSEECHPWLTCEMLDSQCGGTGRNCPDGERNNLKFSFWVLKCLGIFTFGSVKHLGSKWTEMHLHLDINQ